MPSRVTPVCPEQITVPTPRPDVSDYVDDINQRLTGEPWTEVEGGGGRWIDFSFFTDVSSIEEAEILRLYRDAGWVVNSVSSPRNENIYTFVPPTARVAVEEPRMPCLDDDPETSAHDAIERLRKWGSHRVHTSRKALEQALRDKSEEYAVAAHLARTNKAAPNEVAKVLFQLAEQVRSGNNLIDAINSISPDPTD